MAVETLLEAAGVGPLDAVEVDGETARYRGLVLLVTIEYSNLASLQDSELRYRITVDRIPGEYKEDSVLEPFSLSQDSWRIVKSLHGIRIVLQQTGQVGQADVRVMLLTAVTSLGLLAVARSIVDTLAFNVLPLRFVYSQFRTVTSPDFSLVRTLPKRVLQDFQFTDLVNPDPAVFAEYGRDVSDAEVAGSFATGGSRAKEPVQDSEQPRQSGGFFAGLIHRVADTARAELRGG
jgi:hypothetical protein